MFDSEQHTDQPMGLQPAEQALKNMREVHETPDGVEVINPFLRDDPEEEARRRIIAQHKAWLASFDHEVPNPYDKYRIGVYIRYFNQTKYDNYLDYHKQQFVDTIGMCRNWTIKDFYVDEGQSAPNMENARGWCRLLDDCFAGEVDLIITQKISNVSRKPEEIAFLSRILATQKKPVGIYFISEDIFTLAYYYKSDLRESTFIPGGDWEQLPDVDPPFDRLSDIDRPMLQEGNEWLLSE